MRRFGVVPVVALLAAFFMVLHGQNPGRTVRMSDFRYSPDVVRIATGGALAFENVSQTTHTATCAGCSLDTGDVQPGLEKTLTFRNAGVYTFACRYHGDLGMRMTVVVGSSAPSPSPSP